jgi:hypothetical protein
VLDMLWSGLDTMCALLVDGIPAAR